MVKVLLVLLAVVSAKIYVYGPEALRSEIHNRHNGKNEIPSSLANFGNPPYGSVIVGRLFTPINNAGNLGCDHIAPMDFSYGDPDRIVTPILLLNRGHCSFVQKIRHAQDIGASAVIIADTTDEDPSSIVMSDDGTGGNLNIPSFIISKSDGEVLKNAINLESRQGIVSLTLTFEMNQGKGNVTYEIWMSSDQDLARAFLNDFAVYARKLKEVTDMKPHYVLWYCSECRKAGYTIGNPDCVSSGRYCAPDPDGPGPLTGKHVVLEDLRQICVYKEAREKWWDYIQVMNKTCPTKKFDSDCYKTSLEESSIDLKKIESCMNNSFTTPSNFSSDNTLLRSERDELVKAGIFFFPAVIINSQTMRGDIEAEEVLRAVCAGFKEMPKECVNLLEGEKEPGTRQTQEGISLATLIVIVCLAVLLLVAVLVVYRMWLKREMNSELKKQINLAVGQYFALADTSREEA